uniref:Transposase n=1 Tax=Mesocestoides corti TaxID=53468 RepID=A0A5K3G357_MESCO
MFPERVPTKGIVIVLIFYLNQFKPILLFVPQKISEMLTIGFKVNRWLCRYFKVHSNRIFSTFVLYQTPVREVLDRLGMRSLNAAEDLPS